VLPLWVCPFALYAQKKGGFVLAQNKVDTRIFSADGYGKLCDLEEPPRLPCFKELTCCVQGSIVKGKTLSIQHIGEASYGIIGTFSHCVFRMIV